MARKKRTPPPTGLFPEALGPRVGPVDRPTERSTSASDEVNPEHRFFNIVGRRNTQVPRTLDEMDQASGAAEPSSSGRNSIQEAGPSTNTSTSGMSTSEAGPLGSAPSGTEDRSFVFEGVSAEDIERLERYVVPRQPGELPPQPPRRPGDPSDKPPKKSVALHSWEWRIVYELRRQRNERLIAESEARNRVPEATRLTTEDVVLEAEKNNKRQADLANANESAMKTAESLTKTSSKMAEDSGIVGETAQQPGSQANLVSKGTGEDHHNCNCHPKETSKETLEGTTRASSSSQTITGQANTDQTSTGQTISTRTTSAQNNQKTDGSNAESTAKTQGQAEKASSSHRTDSDQTRQENVNPNDEPRKKAQAQPAEEGAAPGSGNEISSNQNQNSLTNSKQTEKEAGGESDSDETETSSLNSENDRILEALKNFKGISSSKRVRHIPKHLELPKNLEQEAGRPNGQGGRVTRSSTRNAQPQRIHLRLTSKPPSPEHIAHDAKDDRVIGSRVKKAQRQGTEKATRKTTAKSASPEKAPETKPEVPAKPAEKEQPAKGKLVEKKSNGSELPNKKQAKSSFPNLSLHASNKSPSPERVVDDRVIGSRVEKAKRQGTDKRNQKSKAAGMSPEKLILEISKTVDPPHGKDPKSPTPRINSHASNKTPSPKRVAYDRVIGSRVEKAKRQGTDERNRKWKAAEMSPEKLVEKNSKAIESPYEKESHSPTPKITLHVSSSESPSPTRVAQDDRVIGSRVTKTQRQGAEKRNGKPKATSVAPAMTHKQSSKPAVQPRLRLNPPKPPNAEKQVSKLTKSSRGIELDTASKTSREMKSSSGSDSERFFATDSSSGKEPETAFKKNIKADSSDESDVDPETDIDSSVDKEPKTTSKKRFGTVSSSKSDLHLDPEPDFEEKCAPQPAGRAAGKVNKKSKSESSTKKDAQAVAEAADFHKLREDLNEGTDRLPAVRGKEDEDKTCITIKTDVNGGKKVFPYRKTVDWESSESVKALNRWRQQVFRREIGKSRGSFVAFADEEIEFVAESQRHPPAGGTDWVRLAADFNRKFMGTIQPSKPGVERPARGEISLMSLKSRIPGLKRADRS
ncbi:MAG: hypothetical protein M1833_000682 [Piccolia ochrophora]|nr:MAG: hypothetical protein M1833_000682 [Piccolia ochrophora]